MTTSGKEFKAIINKIYNMKSHWKELLFTLAQVALTWLIELINDPDKRVEPTNSKDGL